jgi:hypothetical protein
MANTLPLDFRLKYRPLHKVPGNLHGSILDRPIFWDKTAKPNILEECNPYEYSCVGRWLYAT